MARGVILITLLIGIAVAGPYKDIDAHMVLDLPSEYLDPDLDIHLGFTSPAAFRWEGIEVPEDNFVDLTIHPSTYRCTIDTDSHYFTATVMLWNTTCTSNTYAKLIIDGEPFKLWTGKNDDNCDDGNIGIQEEVWF